VLRVAEQYAGTDTGRQRRANEDSLLARPPLFVVADGMGGAQAGEVASRLAVEAFEHGLQDSAEPEAALAALTREANARIHELSHSHAEQAGMGTTLTAVYVGERDVSIAHVGDSRAYRFRDGELLRLTDDHSLVDELLRQGRLTPEEAEEHPQRSVITRALGPEGAVEVDTRSFSGRGGDVYLLCSDGLTTMVAEDRVAQELREGGALRETGEALIAAANEAGGRDNITVLLLRLEELDTSAAPATEQTAAVRAPTDGAGVGELLARERPSAVVPDPERRGAAPGSAAPGSAARGALAEPAAATPMTGAAASAPAVRRRRPRQPAPAPGPSRRRRLRARRAGALAVVVAILALLGAAAYVALQSVYFIGTNDRGLVTVFQGVPYRLPGNLALYTSHYVSGVSASTLSPRRRGTLLDHSLRSEANAAALVRSLEQGQIE
jgi:PPM family protein phosphatase